MYAIKTVLGSNEPTISGLELSDTGRYGYWLSCDFALLMRFFFQYRRYPIRCRSSKSENRPVLSLTGQVIVPVWAEIWFLFVMITTLMYSENAPCAAFVSCWFESSFGEPVRLRRKL